MMEIGSAVRDTGYPTAQYCWHSSCVVGISKKTQADIAYW
ncbi:hypothetical protein JCM19236_3806 [Vibrio sp. JCM 19236]|nr:hypothetical protein JCM19236_3806 [Vibrio sp. JCM 19236]